MKSVTTTLLLLTAVISFAQDQITSIKSGILPGFAPRRFVEYRNQLLFVSSDEHHGGELWISDGTAAGTRLVKDMNLGSGSSSIDRFVTFKDHVYFTAVDDGLAGPQLWVTNGTAAGTKSVSSQVLGIQGPIITDGDLMYFLRFANSKLEVWKSDGSAAGTTMIKGNIDIISTPSNFSLIGNLLYFTVGDYNNSQLWRSDGTASGTFAISNALDGIGTDPGGPRHPSQFLAFNGDLYFIARSGVFPGTQSGLAKAAGDIGGTVAIKSFHNGTVARYGEAFTHNNKMYFTFFQVTEKRFFIVESDGTTDNTTIIFDETYPTDFSPSNILAHGNYFYFTVANTGGGTSLLKFNVVNRSIDDVMGSVLGPYNRIPIFIPQVDVNTMSKTDDGMFIVAKNGQTFGELWYFDILSGTLKQLGNVNSVNSSIIFKKKFYYTGTASVTAPREGLWQSDGTIDGTKVLIGAPENDLGVATFNLYPFIDNAVFRNRDTEHGEELWITDGSTDGTHLLVDVRPGTESSFASPLFELGGSLIFTAYGADGQIQLYKTDGTIQGTSSFTSIADYPNDYKAAKRDDTSFYFLARNRAVENKPNFLYISDATIGGTQVLKNLGTNIYGAAAAPTDIVVADGRAIFSTALDNAALWTSDGTADGTIKIAEFSTINDLVVVNNMVYFTAVEGTEKEVYRTDGTVAGTVMVKNLNGSGSAAPRYLVAFDNKLIFTAVEEDTGRELWITDGTAEGTKLVKDIAPGVDHGIINPQTVVLGDNFFFTADDGEHGSELWKSDGSAEGTILLKDIVPGSDESRPGKFKVVGDEIYFQAFTPEHGYEVWVSDGTAANTKLMFDLIEGPVYSNPEGFIAVNKSTVFFGLTPTDGNQLWSYEEKETITGIEDGQESDLTIFPNPSNGLHHIHLDNESLTNANFEVLTLNGRLTNFNFDNEAGNLNLQNLSPGIYIVKVRTNSRTFTKKVVKF